MKKYKFLKPELFHLEGEYTAQESQKGYRISLKENTWMGFPRSIVENNPDLFEFIGESKPKRPRIKHKKAL